MGKRATIFLALILLIISAALLLRNGDVLTALAVSTTNSTPVTVNISNTPPTCIRGGSAGTNCYDSGPPPSTAAINLIGGYYKTVFCNTTCNDMDGWQDMASWNGTFISGNLFQYDQYNCTASTRNCYYNDSCENVSIVNSTALRIRCAYEVWFNAENSTKWQGAGGGWWTGRIWTKDAAGYSSNEANDTTNITDMMAIGVDQLVNFGVKTPGQNDSTVSSPSMKIYNYGNVALDVRANGSDMQCTVGSIPIDYLHASDQSGIDYNATGANVWSLTQTLGGPGANNAFDMAIIYNNSATPQPPIPPFKYLYWGIGVPQGVSGGCQGTAWFAGVAT